MGRLASNFVARVLVAPWILVAGVALLALGGCDGGGGGGGPKPPTVISAEPVPGATAVAIDTLVTATFSEAMDPASITTSTFFLKDAAQNVVNASVAYDDGVRTATLTPSSALATGSRYIATITTGVLDVSGSALEVDFNWSFTTAGQDVTPPEVVSVSPEAGASDVPVTAAVSARFSEAMDPQSITVDSFTLTPAGPNSLRVPAQVTYEPATYTAILRPLSSLEQSTVYFVWIGESIRDYSRVIIRDEYRWAFATTPSTGAWVQVGGQVSPAGDESEDPTMLVIGSTPAVGYRHQSYRTNLNIWNGVSWGSSKPDPSGNETHGSIHSTPAFDVLGTDVCLAYSHVGDPAAADASFYDRIYSCRWNTSSWVTHWAPQNGGDEISHPYTPAAQTDANEPAIACVSGRNPFVAWIEPASTSAEWDAWIAEVTSTGLTRSAALSRNGNVGPFSTDALCLGMTMDSRVVYLAHWEQHETESARSDLFVTAYEPPAFYNLGGALDSNHDLSGLRVPSLAVNPASTLLNVAYARANPIDGTRHVYVQRWDGSSWTLLGGGPVSAFSAAEHYDSANPDLCYVDNTLFITWDESSQTDGPFIFVARWSGTSSSWVIVGDRLNADVANQAIDPNLAYSPLDHYLYVTFVENTDGHYHVFVKRASITP